MQRCKLQKRMKTWFYYKANLYSPSPCSIDVSFYICTDGFIVYKSQQLCNILWLRASGRVICPSKCQQWGRNYPGENFWFIHAAFLSLSQNRYSDFFFIILLILIEKTLSHKLLGWWILGTFLLSKMTLLFVVLVVLRAFLYRQLYEVLHSWKIKAFHRTRPYHQFLASHGLQPVMMLLGNWF